MRQLSISDPRLNGARDVWIQPTSHIPSETCCLFLDAELYLSPVGAPAVVQGLVSRREIPSVTTAYLSFGRPEDRHVDFVCNRSFSQFLAESLVPFLELETHRHETYVLIGLSLSGLAAAFITLENPDLFPSGICQSPSAWWSDEWLAGHVKTIQGGKGKFWISVGSEETQRGVEHAPGLFQATSQLDSCRRLTEAFNQQGHHAQFEVFNGGHTAEAWAADLPNALRRIFSSSRNTRAEGPR